jgi:predicted cobalt transporter CbtA
MRNIIRTALVIGTLATPMIAMADDAKKDAPAKTDAKDTKDAKAAPAKDAKDAKAPAKKDAKAPAKKDAAKDAKDPAAK